MAAVGGSVLSTTLQVVFNRIALNKNSLLDFFPGNKKFQLKRLERVLQIVSQVLQDAENKQDKSPAVKSWFNSLKHAVYEADDVLDEINTCLKHSKSHIDFSDQFIGELSPRLEALCDALEKRVQQIGVIGLRNLYGKQKREDRLPSTSVVEQSGIFGRDVEKEKITQMVLSNEGGTDISVIPIIGMGGIGKTTLAQLVYNDERVKNHFEKRAWVCISEEFDVFRTTKELLMEVKSSVVDESDDLNHLQVKLEDNLNGKRFIIILDDIWNENFIDYQSLMTPLKSGSRGSKIIVTTRHENIALMLQNEPFHRLRPISDDQSWSLFKLHAFDNRARTLSDEFVTIGKTMVENCKGLPLAIKTVAGVLRSKEDIREWRDMLNNDHWMVEGDIVDALSLSYKLLPSHLKCCFAFCGVFPKDVAFDKEEVALLWMANDLVQPSSQKVAENYFDELRSRSFFEIEMRNDNKYVMHDLVHDLARHVSGYFCARMEDCQLKGVPRGIEVEYDLPPEVLHCSYMSSDDDTLERLRGLGQPQGLRTFLFDDRHTYEYDLGDITKMIVTDILPKLRHIRALSLLYFEISVIPDSIGDLKHLRLLNLAGNCIKKLPNDITKCVNLQTLILADCQSLEELPKDMVLLNNLQTLILSRCRSLKELPEYMGVLINLQHLDVRGCIRSMFFAKMEIWLDELKDIQNLSIVVDEIHGNALEHLDKLQLRQLRTISELGNDVTVEMARSAQLKNKDCIEELSLGWRRDHIPECLGDSNILAELRPHTNIRELEIEGYRGTTFSNWVGHSSFCNLQSFTLQHCNNCIHLPPLGQLRWLKTLKISYMDEISEIGEEFYGSSSTSNRCPSFPNLIEFKISYCKKLKSLPEQMHTQLPALCKLVICDCPELECFPNGGLPPSLESLQIIQCKKLVKSPRNWSLQRLWSLVRLDIWDIEDNSFPEEGFLPFSLERLYIEDCRMEALNPKGFQDLIFLKTLRIKYCPELRCLPEHGLPSSLSRLTISSCSNLEALNHKSFQYITSLTYLHIECCPELRLLPEAGLPSSLSTLQIHCCPNLRYLPEDGLPSSLLKLWIHNCPTLEARIKREKGEDWHKISHIPTIIGC